MYLKKYISAIMLFLLILHGSLHLFVLKIFQTQHKEQVYELISSRSYQEDIVLFKFNKYEFDKGLNYIEWTEENEFRIEGEMYDIVRKEITEDTVYLYCFYDREESNLYNSIIKVLNNLIENDRATTSNVTSIITLLSEFYSNTNEAANDSWLNLNRMYFPAIAFNTLDGEHYLNTPPPRL